MFVFFLTWWEWNDFSSHHSCPASQRTDWCFRQVIIASVWLQLIFSHFAFFTPADLIQCTNEMNVNIPQLADTLFERTASTSWVVVFKSLTTTHHLMVYGNEVSKRTWNTTKAHLHHGALNRHSFNTVCEHWFKKWVFKVFTTCLAPSCAKTEYEVNRLVSGS